MLAAPQRSFVAVNPFHTIFYLIRSTLSFPPYPFHLISSTLPFHLILSTLSVPPYPFHLIRSTLFFPPYPFHLILSTIFHMIFHLRSLTCINRDVNSAYLGGAEVCPAKIVSVKSVKFLATVVDQMFLNPVSYPANSTLYYCLCPGKWQTFKVGGSGSPPCPLKFRIEIFSRYLAMYLMSPFQLRERIAGLQLIRLVLTLKCDQHLPGLFFCVYLPGQIFRIVHFEQSVVVVECHQSGVRFVCVC